MRLLRSSKAIAIFVAAFAFSLAIRAQDQNEVGSPTASSRITESIDEMKLAQLKGQTHPLARAEYDLGVVPDSFPMQHMLFLLKRSPQQEAQLEQLIDQLHDPSSPNYHQWLTAEQFGQQFGPTRDDITIVVNWLESHGFQVNVVYPNGLTIDISGTAAQVRDTFHTEIHYYNVRGERHIANASAPLIPAALEPVVAGFASLNDFFPRFFPKGELQSVKKDPKSGGWVRVEPQPDFTFTFNNTPQYDISPQDFATIYNVRPLWNAKKPITGKGQTIAIVAGSDVQQSDWNTFRAAFGLSGFSGTLTQIHPPAPGTPPPADINCADPGYVVGAATEAALDVEWSGGVAPDASIVLASCANTATVFSAFVAAYNLINGANPPPIISVSVEGCEISTSSLGILWQQAVTEGISVVAGSGDNGAAACDNFDTENAAVDGIAVSGVASTPYDLAVGGVDYQDYFQGTQRFYWNQTNSPTGESAKSYIPEMPWNNSCGNSFLFLFERFFSGPAFCNSAGVGTYLNILAGSGGASMLYPKPSWQSGVLGIPNDGRRDLPDVSLPAASGKFGHALLFCMSDVSVGGAPCNYSNPNDAVLNATGGTSFAAPSFAGIQALIDQKAGGRQGLPNYVLYKLGGAEYGSASHPNFFGLFACDSNLAQFIGSDCTFHDITLGNNDVPCVAGSPNCFAPTGATYGVLSTSTTRLEPAFNAAPGWDFATGLGTPNVTNLVNHWPGSWSY
jgi:subtilase family serine protease